MKPITNNIQKNNSVFEIEVQVAVDKAQLPTTEQLTKWATTALLGRVDSAELTIRIVDTEEMTHLNSTFRHKSYPTNILSFPFENLDDDEMDIPLLGDLVICADVVNREAKEQHKTAEAHWAHIIIHGVLHLLGHDHEIETEAEIMEAIEIEILSKLGISNPYHITKATHHE